MMVTVVFLLGIGEVLLGQVTLVVLGESSHGAQNGFLGFRVLAQASHSAVRLKHEKNKLSSIVNSPGTVE